MLDHSLRIGAAGDRDSRRDGRRWVLVGSLVLHAAAFATLVGVDAWRVEAVAEPPAHDVFQVFLPAPPPADALPAGGRHATPPAHQPERAAARRAAAQPPELHPLTQPSAADSTPRPPHAPTLDGPSSPAVDDREMETPPEIGGGDHGDRSGSGDRRGGPDDGDANGRRSTTAIPLGGEIRRPQIIPGTKVQPVYTEAARQARLQGSVVLQATIDEGGNVIDLRVLKGMPLGLDQEAVRAVSQWKFTPALLHGRAVKVFFTVTVQYEAH